jgi:kelch-like protein 10
MNEKSFNVSAATLNGTIYIVDGFSGEEHLNSAEVYDPEVNQWTYTENISVRSGLSCIAYHGYIYAIGGLNCISCMCSGEKYNPRTNTWMEIPHMFQKRTNFGIAVIDDMIFAVGGYKGATNLNAVEYYDEKSNEWIAARDMNICVSGLLACVIMGLPNVRDYIKYNKDRSMLGGEVAGVVDSGN